MCTDTLLCVLKMGQTCSQGLTPLSKPSRSSTIRASKFIDSSPPRQSSPRLTTPPASPSQQSLDQDIHRIIQESPSAKTPESRLSMSIDPDASPSFYRAYNVTIRAKGKMPVDLVVRPFEVISILKRWVSFGVLHRCCPYVGDTVPFFTWR